MIKKSFNRGKSSINTLSQVVFGPYPKTATSHHHSLNLVLTFLLFMFGVIHWCIVFNWGLISFNAYDWGKEFQYYAILKEAILNQTIPWIISSPIFHYQEFMSYSFVTHSPDILLLPFVSNPGSFFLFHTIFLYCLGFWGCLLFRNKYKLSLLSFAVMFSLFNFNGYIVSHLVVGHTMWGGYYLLPFLLFLLLEMFEGGNQNKVTLGISLILFGQMLLGALHIYVISLLFLFLLGLFNFRYFRTLSGAMLISVFLSMYRFLPSAVIFWGRTLKLITGYPDMVFLWRALTSALSHNCVGSIYGGPHWHEYNCYVGVLGVVLLVGFGGIWNLLKNNSCVSKNIYKFYLPLVCLVFFSMRDYYGIVSKIPIPLISVERLPSRFIVIPIVVLTFFSGIGLQLFIDKSKNVISKIILFVAACFLMADLMSHSNLWRIDYIEKAFLPQTLPLVQIIQGPVDPFYKASVLLGSVISVCALLFCSFSYLFQRSK